MLYIDPDTASTVTLVDEARSRRSSRRRIAEEAKYIQINADGSPKTALSRQSTGQASSDTVSTRWALSVSVQSSQC